MAHERSTAATSRPIHGNDRRRRGRHRRNIDLISSLPNEILQHIFFFIPTKLAIRTSVLSRRWRHVWSDTPSLSFENSDMLHADSINETLTRYTAPKMIKFHFKTMRNHIVPHIDMWIKFAMSRNVEDLSLTVVGILRDYKLPDIFFMNTSINQLSFMLPYSYMNPTCSVSWTSLKKLSLRYCMFSDESIAKILSGCPILESLTLYHCQNLMVLDLSKSPRLRTLEVTNKINVTGPRQIVAPHIHRLRLQNYRSPCALVDVSSLNEAQVDLFFYSNQKTFEAYLHQDNFKMLQKLQNAEKLTFGCNILQILSLAEVCGLPFPMFKIKALTLETEIFQYVIPGIERLLQNSPDLKTVNVHASNGSIIPGSYFDKCLDLQGLNPDRCWRSKDGVFWNKSRSNVESKNVASFVELMLKNTKTLDKMVVQLNERYLGFKLKEVPTLSQKNNVSIVLSTTPMACYEWCAS